MSISTPAAKRVRGEERPRSVPHKGPSVWAVIFSAAFYLSLVGLGASLFVLFARESVGGALTMISFLSTSVLLWILSYFKRRDARCPLCKGTPFLDSAAHTHDKARRYFPLNYGTTNVINSIIFQTYRCHFCGTSFDLLKDTHRQAMR